MSEAGESGGPSGAQGEGDAGFARGELIERRVGPDGQALTLHRRGETWEVRYDDAYVMSTDQARCESALVELAMTPLSQRDDVAALVAGLGLGRTLRAVLDTPGVVRVDVIELWEPIVEWNRGPLASIHGSALSDPRVRVHTGELMSVLKRFRYEAPETAAGLPSVQDGWLAMILDLDSGPGGYTRVSAQANLAIYSDEGLARLEAALRPGGVLGVWSAERDVEFLRRMHARFVNVAELAVPVEIGGESSLDYVYRGRRGAPPRGPGLGKMPQA